MNSNKTFSTFIHFTLVFFLVVFFGLMLFLALYNHPHTDDYIAMCDVRDYGYWGYEKHIYLTWGGRFLSQYLTKIEAYHNFMLYHYYVHTYVLLVLQFVSFFFLLSVINKYLAGFTTHNRSIVLYTLCYMAVQISSLPEVSSAYYWFSSASNYQPGIILIHTELACLILFFFSGKRAIRNICAVASIVCIILINGNNETSALVNGVILTCSFLLAARKRYLPLIACATLLYLLSLVFEVTAPGNAMRSAGIPTAGLIKAAFIAAGRTVYACWIVLKNPLFLASAIAVFFAGSYIKPKALPFVYRVLQNPWMLLIICPILVWIVFVPILYVSNGSFPERADNIITQFIVMLLLFLLFYIGRHFTFSFAKKNLYQFFICLLIITLCCNRFYGELIKSCISGKLHDIILTDREHTLMEASRKGQREVSVLSYDLYADSLINTRFNAEREQVKILMQQKPSVLYLYDDLATSSSIDKLKRFYGFQNINVKRCIDE
jgi:hypothetical protein